MNLLIAFICDCYEEIDVKKDSSFLFERTKIINEID